MKIDKNDDRFKSQQIEKKKELKAWDSKQKQ